jgi:hypothetical protein
MEISPVFFSVSREFRVENGSQQDSLRRQRVFLSSFQNFSALISPDLAAKLPLSRTSENRMIGNQARKWPLSLYRQVEVRFLFVNRTKSSTHLAR